MSFPICSDLSHNDLFEIQPGMLEGIGDKLTNL